MVRTHYFFSFLFVVPMVKAATRPECDVVRQSLLTSDQSRGHTSPEACLRAEAASSRA